MSNYEDLQLKLSAFINKFYKNELIKGTILFLAIGCLYFLFVLFLEYFLWLKPLGRAILFWTFIGIELFLFTKYILYPLSKMMGLRKGLTDEEASLIIGDHFSNVEDKLLNILQLKSESDDSELVLASIDQKSSDLKLVPFQNAINFLENKKYLKYLAIPLLIFLITLLTGNKDIFGSSYERVINYSENFEAPAPFQFYILNDNLNVKENSNLKLIVRTEGTIVPDVVKIVFDNEEYILKNKGGGNFEYEFESISKSLIFQLSANEIVSKNYEINVDEIPVITKFKIKSNYPSYIKRSNDVFENTGNLTVPEGTKLSWELTSKATNKIDFFTDSLNQFITTNYLDFSHSLIASKSFNYSIITSNEKIKNHETIDYKVKVIKDAYPEIVIKTKNDSLTSDIQHHFGQVSDDYGISKIRLVYYEENDDENKQFYIIKTGNSNVEQFTYSFPQFLDLKDGKSYIYYFQVFDNDGFNGSKASKSQLFNFNKLTESDRKDELLKKQSESIQGLNNALDKIEKSEKELDAISKTNKEKKKLNWNDKKKLSNFIKRQEQQQELIKNFNKQLNNNLDEFNKNDEDDFKKSLKERLENQEKEIAENEKLLKELKDLQDKIREENLSKKIDDLKNKNESQKRSLEQLVELTKRYYVSQKQEKLSKDLEKLSKKQEELSNEDGDNKEAQDKLNKKFDDIKKDLEELRKENNDLKNPMQLGTDKNKESEVQKEQKNASENLEKNKSKKANDNQKKASEQMKQMSKNMMQMQMQQSGEQLEEDAKMLRQILDNLIFYSFDQEELMNKFSVINRDNSNYSNYLRKQHVLREHFEHVDDSLFALSLRNPMISDKINKEVTDVHFNIDKSIEHFSETEIYKGSAKQQYAITAANNLADYLSEVLNNMQNQMQNQMPGSGSCDKPGGSGQSFQLSDIIKEQEQNIEGMKEGMKGKSGNKDGKEGDDGKQKDGKNGKSGNSSEGDSNEQMSGELFEIFKKQQDLKNQLKDALGENGQKNGNSDLLDKMEDIEEQLLDKGFTNEVLEKMINLKHELLKLEDAKLKQGEDDKREANKNNKDFINNTNNKIPSAKEYFNEFEILNRQALPLQTIYKEKVNSYFKGANN